MTLESDVFGSDEYKRRYEKAQTILDDDMVNEWLFTPNAAARGKAPIELTTEEFDRIYYFLTSGDPE